MKFDFLPSEWEELYQKCDFTDQEKDIIQLKRRGWELSRIAAELYLSERTINRRINSISRKILRVI